MGNRGCQALERLRSRRLRYRISPSQSSTSLQRRGPCEKNKLGPRQFPRRPSIRKRFVRFRIPQAYRMRRARRQVG
ncbi:hypothetical protein P692DRAFT_20933019 [Suillus brevipes Sb2]|nr:hypothetical protein P692DRAFT_20933019 [Suillus brevipes Sb2]